MTESVQTKTWAILQGRSFFPVVGSSKRAAIAEFVMWNDKHLYENKINKPNGPSGTLCWRQKDAWAECEARGIQCVRALIVEAAP